MLDTIKTLAFRYATKAGVTISKNDIVVPPEKEEILARYEAEVAKVEREYERGLMTEEERKERDRGRSGPRRPTSSPRR